MIIGIFGDLVIFISQNREIAVNWYSGQHYGSLWFKLHKD